MTLTKTLIPSTRADSGPDAGDRPDRRLLVGYLHKTSNTLCGIKGYASLIADRGAEAGESGAWARKIIAEVERMEEIFRSVGDMTRGRRHPDIGVDLPGLVRGLAEDFSRGHSASDVRCVSIPDGELLIPVADLGLVITEILGNCAEHAAGPTGRVDIVIRGEINRAGRVCLAIQDNGGGMDPELAAQAPRPFVTTKEGHIGVGLTRVDTLMEMYGLAWNLESETGTGTTISFEIAEVC